MIKRGPGHNVYKAGTETLQKIIGEQAFQIEILKNGRAVRERMEADDALRRLRYRVQEMCCSVRISRGEYYQVRRRREKAVSLDDQRDMDKSERIKAIRGENQFWE